MNEPSIEIQTVEWKMLIPHAQRGALFLVKPTVELGAAARAVATDDAESVKAWLASEELALVPPESVAPDAATETSDDEVFRFAIVQPYVLAQRLS